MQLFQLVNPQHFDQPATPHNLVFFQVEMSMTKYELMDYLRNLYKIPVADIDMKVIDPVFGRDHRGKVYVSKKEHRLARVLLEHGWYFEYPKIFEEPGEETGEGQVGVTKARKDSDWRDAMWKDMETEMKAKQEGKTEEKQRFWGRKSKSQQSPTYSWFFG